MKDIGSFNITKWVHEDGHIRTFKLAAGERPPFSAENFTLKCFETTAHGATQAVLAIYLLHEPRRISVDLESKPSIILGRRTTVDILDSKNKTLKSYTLEDHTNQPLIHYVDIIAAEKYFVKVSVNYTEDVRATKLLRDETLERSRSDEMKSVEFPAMGVAANKTDITKDALNFSYESIDFVEGDNLITYFVMRMELLRPLRTEVYPYVVEKVEELNYDGTSRDYSINASYFAGSIYDRLNVTITPEVGDYKGSSKDLLFPLDQPPVKPLTRRAGRFKAVMPLECAEFVSGESECFWEMLIKDDVGKLLTRPRKFHNGTEIPELKSVGVFLDESYTNKTTLFFCYVKPSTTYDVHKWTTAIEVVPVQSHQLKAKLTMDILEERPRYMVIKWSVDDLPANISGIRISVGIFDGAEKYKELESGILKTTGVVEYQLGYGGRGLKVQVAVNFTDDHVIEFTEEKKIIEPIEEIKVVDLKRVNNSEKEDTKVTLKWNTTGARPFEAKKLFYEIKKQIWQKEWTDYSTTVHKADTSGTQAYVFDSVKLLLISPRLQVTVTPKFDNYTGISDTINFSLKTGDLEIDVRVVKFGTGLRLTCIGYKPGLESHWERQEDGKDDSAGTTENRETLHIVVEKGQLYYRCYVKEDYYKQTTAIYIFGVEGPPPSPQLNLRIVRSKPYKLHVDWVVDWREEIPTRSFILTVKQDDSQKLEKKTLEKKGTISTEITADSAKITVLGNASYGENLHKTTEKIINIEPITLVNFGMSDEAIDTMTINWKVMGVLPEEEPQYKIKITCGNDYEEEKMIKQNSTVVPIKRRPYNCELKAQAILESYEGPIATYTVKLDAKALDVAPTNVKFTTAGPTTIIEFDPIPAEVMQRFGIDKGCQVSHYSLFYFRLHFSFETTVHGHSYSFLNGHKGGS
ncbi:unnamed protein product [Haemonchus placei]|uniref:Ig-like domain-containing protein n=1 Tax=Haemonchus placei TaxID=6290 RepID=A0A158QPY7_HAEPC|nr:unnamed protein product [Haemonchus placei]